MTDMQADPSVKAMVGELFRPDDHSLLRQAAARAGREARERIDAAAWAALAASGPAEGNCCSPGGGGGGR